MLHTARKRVRLYHKYKKTTISSPYLVRKYVVLNEKRSNLNPLAHQDFLDMYRYKPNVHLLGIDFKQSFAQVMKYLMGTIKVSTIKVTDDFEVLDLGGFISAEKYFHRDVIIDNMLY